MFDLITQLMKAIPFFSFAAAFEFFRDLLDLLAEITEFLAEHI